MLRATWTTWTPGRRCALAGASAAVVALGGLLAACGGGSGEGYVATGAAGGPPGATGTAAAPSGAVRLVPLDGRKAGGEGRRVGNSRASEGSRTRGAGEGAVRATEPGPAPSSGAASASASAPGGSAGPPAGTAPPATASPAPRPEPAAPAPARLTVGGPEREPTDRRRCEKVTVAFGNSGGTPVRSGTVTFGTHVIGALGITWATTESTGKLPAPIAPGAREEQSWTVCVDRFYEASLLLGARMEHDVTVTYPGAEPIFIPHTPGETP